MEQKRRAEAAAYGVRRSRRVELGARGQTESRDCGGTVATQKGIMIKLTSVRRGASSVDDDSAFEDSDELAAEAEIAELKAAIAAERAKGGV